MKMKPGLLLAAILIFATSAQAQHSHGHSPSGGSSQSGGQGNWSGGFGGSVLSSRAHALHYEEPRQYVVGYAKNDGEFVPSTFMNYDDAVALGQQQIAAAEKQAQSGGGPSLGEVARAYRNAKTSKLEASLIQGDSGKMEVCNLNGSGCRRL